MSNEDGIAAFSRLIEAIHDKVVIYFSDAHIQDIYPFHYWGQFKAELDYLSDLSRNNYLFQTEKGEVRPITRSPLAVFFEMLDWENCDLQQFLTSRAGALREQLLGEIKEIYKQTDFDKVNQAEMIHREKAETSDDLNLDPEFFKTIENCLSSMSDFLSDTKSYKNERLKTRDGLLLPTSKLSSSQSPFSEMNKALRAYTSNPNIRIEMIPHIVSCMYPESNQIWIKFISMYILLDLMGYHSDKMNDKNQPKNLFIDIKHAFYGAHCDYYITLDFKHLHKVKLLYDSLKSRSVACRPSEFVEIWSKRSC